MTHYFEADEMLADFAEVGTADFSEICLLVSVADEDRTRFSQTVTGDERRAAQLDSESQATHAFT